MFHNIFHLVTCSHFSSQSTTMQQRYSSESETRSRVQTDLEIYKYKMLCHRRQNMNFNNQTKEELENKLKSCESINMKLGKK